MDAYEEMKKIRGSGYQPRTRHLNADGSPQYTNRLFLESSPYLLQHAHNPVDWYPWSDEAFEAAKKLDRPVLLSVGYSTCHWCHVMEEESFEDEEIAGYINEHYIPIKVDREERPDVDAVYMRAVQAITGHGGWPMTVWLTPDKKPFYGGTYFPARDGDRGANVGFLSLLMKIQDIYHRERASIQKSGVEITQRLMQQHLPKTNTRRPDQKILQQIIDYYKRAFDPVHGGMSGAPKFPSTFPIRLLFRHHRRTGDPDALRMAAFTLEKMANGGMYDHVGGGFHRYATDEQWLVPHFEKMLYDNALLVVAYLDGYQVTGNTDFKRVAMEILEYVHRDMTSPEGAFYSATDADSLTPKGEREEGFFFTWTPAELDAALGKKSAAMVRAYYGADGDANFEGRHILFTPNPPEKVATSLGISKDRLYAEIEIAKEKLYQWRSRRPHCLRDEKIITAWNGLMISAHARAGLILDEPRYVERAAAAAEFVLNHLYIDNRLYRTYKDGQSRHKGYLDDYAFFIAGLLDLFEATQEIRWLKTALKLDDILETNFEDIDHGGFYMTGHDHEILISREKPDYDGAEPSGNSIAVMNLLRFSALTANDRFRQRAEKALIQFLGRSETLPIGLTEMLLAFDFYLDHPKEIVIVTPNEKKREAEPFLGALRSTFLPNRVLMFGSSDQISSFPADMLPIAKTKELLNGKTTGYVCEKGICGMPTNDPDAFAVQLNA